uniref:CCDC113/CCDC96 coiled-coil domain-containing protein n=1 Tax=Neobodo designis TaxID=312471 RepID=A0A7S1KZ52_NEODS
MADIDEEERQNLAAAIIQTRYREYRRRQLELEQAAMGADGMDDVGEVAERTEEEERAMLLSKVAQLYDDRKALIAANLAHQRQLAKHFADRRAAQADAANANDGGALTADADAKYWELVGRLRNDRAVLEQRRQEAQAALDAYKERHEDTIVEAEQQDAVFRAFLKEQASQAVFPRNNKPIPQRKIDEFLAREEQMYNEIHAERVTGIKLRNKCERLAKALKKKEKQNDGMHLIDFEQLKIENTNLNERIEERNEDLLKLRKKATTTIHVLTHVKEKLEFVKAENTQLQRQVTELEELLAALRDKLTQTKKDRDLFVNENLRMKEKMPMIGSEDLLLDYELRKKQIEDLRIEVVNLNNTHHELMQWISSHQAQLDKLQKASANA